MITANDDGRNDDDDDCGESDTTTVDYKPVFGKSFALRSVR